MKLKSSSYFLIVVMAIALFLGIVSLTYTSPKDKLVPLIASGVIVILGAIRLRTEIMAPPEASENEEFDDDLVEDSGETENKREGFAFLWLAGLVASILLFGFLITVPLFTLAYLRLGAHHGWLESLALAVAAELFLYSVFVLALRANLFPGILLGG